MSAGLCHRIMRHSGIVCAVICAATVVAAHEVAEPAFTVPKVMPPHPRLFMNAAELTAMKDRVASSQFPQVLECKQLWRDNNHFNRQYFTNHQATHVLGWR